MRTLVVGAGALGGYFGGRLLAAHRDVTFLVRPARAAELDHSGLQIRSSFGDVNIPAPPIVLAKDLSSTFDLVLLSCKAYDLENALDSFAPAVGPATVIIPVLNGMRHLDILDSRFGSGHTLAGYCFIAANLNERHEIVHLNDRHTLSFGERDGTLSDRVKTIETFLRVASFDVKASTTGILDMWEKWVFLATLAGSTCLMRASVGEIVSSPGGREFMVSLLAECRAIATAAGYPPTEVVIDAVRNLLTAEASTLTASMLRDIEKQGPVEADHVIGDLLIRGEYFGLPPNTLPLLANVYTNLKAYEARRQRVLNLITGK